MYALPPKDTTVSLCAATENVEKQATTNDANFKNLFFIIGIIGVI
jgi:hypothetical protein